MVSKNFFFRIGSECTIRIPPPPTISASSNNIAIVSSLTDRTIYNSKHLWYFLFYIPEMFRYKLKNSQLHMIVLN